MSYIKIEQEKQEPLSVRDSVRQTKINISKMIAEVVKQQCLIDPFKNPTLRVRDLADARALTMKLIRQFTMLSLSDIGKLWATKEYKGKDHASVLHSQKKSDALIESDPEFKHTYMVCCKKIRRLLSENDYESIDPNPYEQISRLKHLNIALVNRRITQKGHLEKLAHNSKYIPKKYLIYIEKHLKKCLTLS